MMSDTLKKCDTPDCDRLVPDGVLYCCGPCSDADVFDRQDHESGTVHAHECDEKHRRRSAHPPTDSKE